MTKKDTQKRRVEKGLSSPVIHDKPRKPKPAETPKQPNKKDGNE